MLSNYIYNYIIGLLWKDQLVSNKEKSNLLLVCRDWYILGTQRVELLQIRDSSTMVLEHLNSSLASASSSNLPYYYRNIKSLTIYIRKQTSREKLVKLQDINQIIKNHKSLSRMLIYLADNIDDIDLSIMNHTPEYMTFIRLLNSPQFNQVDEDEEDEELEKDSNSSNENEVERGEEENLKGVSIMSFSFHLKLEQSSSLRKMIRSIQNIRSFTSLNSFEYGNLFQNPSTVQCLCLPHTESYKKSVENINYIGSNFVNLETLQIQISSPLIGQEMERTELFNSIKSESTSDSSKSIDYQILFKPLEKLTKLKYFIPIFLYETPQLYIDFLEFLKSSPSITNTNLIFKSEEYLYQLATIPTLKQLTCISGRNLKPLSTPPPNIINTTLDNLHLKIIRESNLNPTTIFRNLKSLVYTCSDGNLPIVIDIINTSKTIHSLQFTIGENFNDQTVLDKLSSAIAQNTTLDSIHIDTSNLQVLIQLLDKGVAKSNTIKHFSTSGLNQMDYLKSCIYLFYSVEGQLFDYDRKIHCYIKK